MNKLSCHSPSRILLIKPSSMGDVIHALPVVSALHARWPQAEIRWLIHPAFRELVEHHPAVSKIILFPREKFRGVIGFGAALLWARKLRHWKPDLTIDLQCLLRSALMARCSKATTIIGLSDAREGASLFYTSNAKIDPLAHAVTRYLGVLDHLNIPKPPPDFHLPQGKLPNHFLIKEPFVVLHPYARGDGKNLTTEQVKSFALSLGVIPIVLVGQGERMRGLPSNVIDWTGRTTLLELIAILRKATFIVSSDSGPMHLAAALQPSKTLAIHRWSDPLRVGPWAQESFVWKNGTIITVHELTEKFRAPGNTPTIDEMRVLGNFVQAKIVSDSMFS